jgi:agmatine deiminase
MADTFYMPPEWAPHQGTWLSWPHNPDTWPGRLAAAEAALDAAVVALARAETVHINVNDAAVRDALVARFAGRVPDGAVRCHVIPTDDAWCRDHGPIFAYDAAAQLIALKFRFNAWGEKYPHALDATAGTHMASALGVDAVVVDMVLEGGSIEVNGAGALLTTEQCLLNDNRNPGMSRADIEQALSRCFGVSQILWLGDGIVGDDTDGHIDDLTRFVAADRVVTVVEADPRDANYAPLKDNLERLRAIRLDDGRPLSIVELPMPDPQVGPDGRLPASYANFYVGSEVVLLPTFACRQDAQAIATLQRCYPTRRVVPIDCRAVVVGLGTLHCLTQQIPVSQRP